MDARGGGLIEDRLSAERILTMDERKELADRLLAEHLRHLDYIRMSTVTMSLLPVLYGILTFVYGDELWAGSTAYATALQVPWAPQSWGALFFTLGAISVYCAWHRHDTATAVVTLFTSIVMAMFMVTFLTEFFSNGTISALPPVIVYCVFALAFLNRSRLAWLSRKD